MSSKWRPQNATAHGGTEPNPNNLSQPRTAEEAMAAGTTCLFLGKTFYEGDTVCWQSVEWVCTNAGWQKSGNAC